MKQYITEAQAKELNEKQKSAMVDYLVPGDYWGNPYESLEDLHKIMSIGRMIEFLDKQERCDWCLDGRASYIELTWKNYCHTTIQWGEELCDALWEAVKQVLIGEPVLKSQRIVKE